MPARTHAHTPVRARFSTGGRSCRAVACRPGGHLGVAGTAARRLRLRALPLCAYRRRGVASPQPQRPSLGRAAPGSRRGGRAGAVGAPAAERQRQGVGVRRPLLRALALQHAVT
eukprot:6512910-Prymnesium_polylepis.1